jgi:hypothetical protein
MGVKLMKFIVCITCLFSSCSTSREYRHSDFYVKREDFIKAYKAAFFCGCMNGGTAGNFYKFLKDNNDLGLFSEGDLISHFRVNEADSIGRTYSNKIEPFNYGDGLGKKPVFSRCMVYALSAEVEKLARESYKQTMKSR